MLRYIVWHCLNDVSLDEFNLWPRRQQPKAFVDARKFGQFSKAIIGITADLHMGRCPLAVNIRQGWEALERVEADNLAIEVVRFHQKCEMDKAEQAGSRKDASLDNGAWYVLYFFVHLETPQKASNRGRGDIFRELIKPIRQQPIARGEALCQPGQVGLPSRGVRARLEPTLRCFSFTHVLLSCHRVRWGTGAIPGAGSFL